MKFSVSVLAVCCSCGLSRAGTEASALWARAQGVLKQHCAGCHGQEGTAKGGFGYVLDRDRLIARGKVVPGGAAESELLQRLHAGEMPPAGKQRPSKEDVAVLKRWIDAGAPGSAAKARPFVPDHAVLKAIAADLETIEPRQRRHARYLTLTHLANAGLSDADLQTVRQALGKLINSLSWHTRITRPRPIDGDQTVYRIDLRQYKWTASSWDRLVSAYPYRPATVGHALKAIAKATECELPVLKADWFVATASRPPLYYDLLQMPTSERTLERLLQVDVVDNIKEELVVRAGFNDSGVSKNNRVIERHDAAYGAYWRSYDFAGNTGRQNVFEHPLGPNTGETSFAHAGGEIIFHLPNGLQGFLLTDAAGRRLDKAPSEIVSDPKRPDQRVEAGVSCMACHVRGIIPKADQVRGHVEKNANAFAKADRDRIQVLYPPKARMQALMDEDNERYLRALAKTVGWAESSRPTAAALDSAQPAEDQVSAVTLRYEATLDVRAAAAELCLTPAEFAKRLAKAPSLVRILGALNAKGGTVQRQVFQEAFPEIARVFRLGEDDAPVAGITPFSGHKGAVLCVGFSADGRRAASGGADRMVRLWDVASGNEVRRFDGHTGDVTAVVFTADGKHVLSAGADKTLRLWDATNGETIRVFKGHTDRVRCLAVSANSQRAASGADDHTIRLWDIASGKDLGSLQGHTRAVTSIAFARPWGGREEEAHVVSASLDGSIRMWSILFSQTIRRFEGHVGEVYTVAVSPDGSRIVSGGNDRTVRLWDARTGQEIRAFRGHVNAVIRVAFAADGRSILSASSQYRQADKVIRIWSIDDGRELRSLADAEVSIAAMAFAPAGDAALSGGADAALRLWRWTK